MVSSGAKMSYERRLWSRQEVSFPYIVVCWSTSRILILLEGMRGCQPVQKAWPWASGSVGKQEPLQKKDHSAPWLLKQHQLSELESCYDERRGRGGMCFILPSLTQETIPPSQIYFTLPHPSSFYSLGSPPPPPPIHAHFFPTSFHQPFDFALIPHILPWCFYLGHNRDLHGFGTTQIPRTSPLSQSVENPRVIKPSGLDYFMAHTTCEETRKQETRFLTGFNRAELAQVRKWRVRVGMGVGVYV